MRDNKWLVYYCGHQDWQVVERAGVCHLVSTLNDIECNVMRRRGV